MTNPEIDNNNILLGWKSTGKKCKKKGNTVSKKSRNFRQRDSSTPREFRYSKPPKIVGKFPSSSYLLRRNLSLSVNLSSKIGEIYTSLSLSRLNSSLGKSLLTNEKYERGRESIITPFIIIIAIIIIVIIPKICLSVHPFCRNHGSTSHFAS